MSFLGRHRALAGLAVGVPVSLVFLWLAVRDANLDEVWETLRGADAADVALGVALLLAVYLAQAARWRSIAGARTLSTLRFYEMVVSAVACNNVLPARLGDVLRARWLNVHGRMPAGRALGTVVLDRGCDLAALVGLLAVGLLAVTAAGWLVRIVLASALAVGLLVGAVVFARLYTARRARGRHARGLVRRIARDVVEQLAEPIGRRRLLLWAGLSVLAWTVWATGAVLVARSLGIELSPLEGVFVAAVMNLGVAIPSSPGFVGTYEWLGVASLGLLDVPATDALAFAILLHAAWYVPTTLGGGAALAVRGAGRLRAARRGDASGEPAADERAEHA
ncbi:MAG TPA: lysylphosphatidylglycerol synthase transmembrane domain-containing protein [Gaiellaceae bacterium]|nr:lysylphosphatidylglycerol synthase transmembrane domain-containing protein [Gaiellaceae bacterium]